MKKPFTLNFVLIHFMLLCAANACAASFDCNKAKTQIEKGICGNPELSRLDEDLAVAYKRALDTFPVKGFIRAWQRDWLSSVRWTTCKTDCSEELIPLYKNRLEQLNIGNNALIFSNSPSFSIEDTNAVVIINPSGQGAIMSVWGGFMIHSQASNDSGKPVYLGCTFNGRMSSPTSNSAVEDSTTINFTISQNRLKWVGRPDICVGFGQLPEEIPLISLY